MDDVILDVVHDVRDLRDVETAIFLDEVLFQFAPPFEHQQLGVLVAAHVLVLLFGYCDCGSSTFYVFEARGGVGGLGKLL
jgi:hypothetical protein